MDWFGKVNIIRYYATKAPVHLFYASAYAIIYKLEHTLHLAFCCKIQNGNGLTTHSLGEPTSAILRGALQSHLMNPLNTYINRAGFGILLGHTGISIKGQGSPWAYIVRAAGARGGNKEIL